MAIFITDCLIYCVDVMKFKDTFKTYLNRVHLKRKFEILKLKDASASSITEASLTEKMNSF